MNQTFRILLLVALAVLGALAGPARAAILELSGPAGTSVVINGRARGYLPLEHPLDLGPGRYLVECSLPGHKDYRAEVVLAEESDWKRLHVRLTPYSRSTGVFSNIVFAGLGQHYLDKPAKGWFFNIAEAGGLITAMVAEAGRVNYRKDYLLLKERYDTAINSDDLDYYRQQTESAYSDMEDMEKLRDTGLMVAGGAIVLSMLDALIFFPGLEAGPGPGPSPADTDDEYGALGCDPRDYFTTVHAGLKLSF
jgi:hypothetical protein